MLTEILVGVAIAIVGFISGVLVGRKHKVAVEAVVDTAKDLKEDIKTS